MMKACVGVLLILNPLENQEGSQRKTSVRFIHRERVSTFDNAGKLFYVVVCFSVVNNSSNREYKFRLDLRKSVKDTLRCKNRVKTFKFK